MEIEKKFLINEIPSNLASYPHHEIAQAYLNTNPVIRIRQLDTQYILTIKSDGLMAREEHEFSLPQEAYEHLLTKADGNAIQKTRYLLPDSNGYTIELDCFHGIYEGLYLAEVEFPTIEEANAYTPAKWFSKEVTTDGRFHNSFLSQASPAQIEEIKKVS